MLYVGEPPYDTVAISIDMNFGYRRGIHIGTSFGQDILFDLIQAGLVEKEKTKHNGKTG